MTIALFNFFLNNLLFEIIQKEKKNLKKSTFNIKIRLCPLLKNKSNKPLGFN